MRRLKKSLWFLPIFISLFLAALRIAFSQAVPANVLPQTVFAPPSYGDFLNQELPQDFSDQGDFHLERTVGKGVQFYTEFHAQGPFFINYLTVDLGAPGIALDAEKARDSVYAGERVQQIASHESANGHFVVAAVNGDFWTTRYRPTGLFVDDGKIFNSPASNRTVFVLTSSGEPFIGKFDFSTTLTTSAGAMTIDAINFTAKATDLVLFTPASGDLTPDLEGRTEILLDMETDEFLPNKDYGGTVAAVKKNSRVTPLGARRWVLSASRKPKDLLEQTLKPGDKIKIRATLAGITKPIVFVLGGGPLLLHNGNVDINAKRDSVAQSFITTRHPRTAIGYSKDKRKLFLLTVDGRQPLVSIGFNLYELADYLKALGADEAMNLDGGGSTTMWVRGAVVNKPSDITGPRIVTNAFLVFTRSRLGDLVHIDVIPRFPHVPVDTAVQFTTFGTDYNYNPVPLDGESLRWYATKAIGTISEDGLLRTAQTPGEGSVMVRTEDRHIFNSVPVRIDRVARIEVEPAPLVLRQGESLRLHISALDSANNRMFLPADALQLDVPPQLAWEAQSSLIRGLADGTGKFTVSIADARRSVPFSVGIFDTRIIESFDRLPEGGEKAWLSGERFDADLTHVKLNENEKKQGDASLELDYAMQHGGTTSIELNLNAPIPDTPARIGIWVYGDGKGHWLRGEAKDKDGELFIIDFTEGGKGIFWNKEWRYLEIDRSKIVPKWTNPAAHLDYPLTLLQIYLAQSQEAKKSDGSVLLDSLEALYFPSN